MVLNPYKFDLRDFTMIVSIIDEVLKRNNIQPLIKNMSANGVGPSEKGEERKKQAAAASGRLYVPTNSKRQA